MIVYDKAQNHFLGHFPADLPIEQAYVHIGIFIGWIIQEQLYSDDFEDEAGTQILRFLRRETSCALLSEIWDGYLGEELLNEEANDFAQYYYASGKYLEDYKQTLAKELPNYYYVGDTWENYDKMAVVISERFVEWHQANR